MAFTSIRSFPLSIPFTAHILPSLVLLLSYRLLHFFFLLFILFFYPFRPSLSTLRVPPSLAFPWVRNSFLVFLFLRTSFYRPSFARHPVVYFSLVSTYPSHPSFSLIIPPSLLFPRSSTVPFPILSSFFLPFPPTPVVSFSLFSSSFSSSSV